MQEDMVEFPPKLLEQDRILETKWIHGQGGHDLLVADEQRPPLGEDIALNTPCCARNHACAHADQAVA
ncbi:hypothetical protein PEC18_31060 [Paucibacter sp. O1-1]|nr:hypothetical protein [Paucibacter sp. O1-1]MDA3830145.1 hypothetical protein [Paucibacter sp. O1-1]